MRKLRDDSTWNQLTAEQRESLESWLFDENLGYEKTVARVQKEFGLDTTIASVGRYYRRRARERQAEELVEAQVTAIALNELPVSSDTLRVAAVKLLGKLALKLASEQPGDWEALAALTRILLASEDNDLQRARVKLAERYLDYEAAAAAQKELPHFRACLFAIRDDPNLSWEAKSKKTDELLWGRTEVGSGANGVKEPTLVPE